MGRKKLLAVVALSASLLGGLTIASGSASALRFSTIDGEIKVTSISETPVLDYNEDTKTYTLISDIDEGIYVEKDTTVTIDLNGKTVTNEGQDFSKVYTVIVNGDLTINDSTNEGSIKSEDNWGIEVQYGGNVTLNSGNISTNGAGVTVFNKGTTFTMNGGTITAKNHFGISGNGTEGKGGYTINFNGGTINSNMTTLEGYSSCGIYHPNTGTVNITGGTINSSKGAGVVVRAGDLNITGGTINAVVADESNKDYLGKVGDSRVIVPTSAVVIEYTSGYPGLTEDPIDVKISGEDTVLASSSDVVTVLGSSEEGGIEIAGGTFSNAPVSELIAAGYAAFKAEDGTYYVAEDKAENITITAFDEVTEDADEDHTSNEQTLSVSIYAVITKIADSLSTLVKGSEVTDEDSGVTATISDAEKLNNAIKNKEALSVVLATKESSVSKETKAYIESVALPEGSTMLDTNEVWVALKDGSDNELAELTQLADEVTVVLTDIEADAEVADGYTRTWGIVRVHYNSESKEYDYDLLEAEYNEEEKTLTFTSDEFSEFVAYYTDTENATDDDDEDTKGDDTTDDEDTKGDDTTDDEDTKGDDTEDSDDTKGDDESDDTTDTDTTDTDTDEETDTDTDSESDADTDTDTNSEEDEEESSESSDTTTPETGRFTAEEEGASDTQIITIVASIVVLAGIIGFAIKAKKSAKKNA